MELQFEKKPRHCLRQSGWQNQNVEQTLELRAPEELVGNCEILGVWGQLLIRGKEWRGNEASADGGVICHVLLSGTAGYEKISVEGWMPFQFRWDLKNGGQDGSVHINCRIGNIEARMVGSEKIMIRAQISAFAQKLEPDTIMEYVPGDIPDDVQLLREVYPLRLAMEAGEKELSFDEDLIMPPEKGNIEKIITFSMRPKIPEMRLMTDKLVYRGSANLHMVYLAADGHVKTYDSELPISQYIQLDREYGDTASVRIDPIVTNMELEKLDDGRIHVSCGFVSQYLITDTMEYPVVADAYSPLRNVEMKKQPVQIPVVLDENIDDVTADVGFSLHASEIVDCRVCVEHPRIRRGTDEMTLDMEGSAQVLYYNNEGSLECVQSGWEMSSVLTSDGGNQIIAKTITEQKPILLEAMNGLNVQIPLQNSWTVMGATGPETISDLSLSEKKEMEEDRPSLILRRVGATSLWEIAKNCGSTVSKIKDANHLEGDPNPDQMLLIPIQ